MEEEEREVKCFATSYLLPITFHSRRRRRRPRSTARLSAATFTALESSVKLTLSGREGRGRTAGVSRFKVATRGRDKGDARLPD